jgi:3-phenylpropionate/cinnamic acid dioxygenase small subunit
MDLKRLALRAEIEDFLYAEAELLDQRRFSEWLDLLAEDVVYFMPLRRNVPFGEHEARENTRIGKDINWFDEDKWTLTKRVEQLMTGLHWAEEPLSRVTHMVSNVQVVEVLPSLDEPQEVVARCRFLIYQNRGETETNVLVGKRRDSLRKEDGSWRLARREVLLDQNVLTAKSLTVFF